MLASQLAIKTHLCSSELLNKCSRYWKWLGKFQRKKQTGRSTLLALVAKEKEESFKKKKKRGGLGYWIDVKMKNLNTQDTFVSYKHIQRLSNFTLWTSFPQFQNILFINPKNYLIKTHLSYETHSVVINITPT